MTTLMWWLLGSLAILGATACVVLAALEYWVAFFLFLAVFVIGVLGMTVQAVSSS